MTAPTPHFSMWDASNSCYVCVECGNVFNIPKVYRENHGLDAPPYEYIVGCPRCGGAFVEAKICDCCGHPITGDYVQIEDGSHYCDNCYHLRDVADDLLYPH